MNLNPRPARIGASINSRSEKHGDYDVPAMDVPIEAVMLTKFEVCELQRDPTFWDRHFNERTDGLPEPADKNVKPLGLIDKYEHSSARITVGLDEREFAFSDCSLTKFKLTPCVGGLTELQVTIQVLIEESNTALFEFMAKDCTAELTLGTLEKKKDSKQAELALDARGDAPPPPTQSEEEERAPRRRTKKVGTPEQERAKAAKREAKIAKQIQKDQNGASAPA